MRIAFIKVGLNSYLNRAVEQILADGFPEHRVVTFDVTHDLFGGSCRAVAAGAAYALRQYGAKALRSRNSLLNNFYTTGYFQAVRRLARKTINPADFLFSFQTQALFDASIPRLPHFVYTDHTHLANLAYPGFDRENLAPPAWIELEREIYQNAAMVFTMSSNIARSLVDQYGMPASQTACVYAGCGLPADDGNISNDRFGQKHILFTGKDWERKGGPVLLRAFEQIQRAHPDARLTIIGCQPDAPLPPGCTAYGHVSREKLIDAYRHAAVFCLPTRLEPFGLAILEAMTFGLPVVATDIGAIPELVEEDVNGYRIRPDDVDGLALVLNRLLADPALCARLGAAGRARIANRYNWTNTGRLLHECISNIIQGQNDSG